MLRLLLKTLSSFEFFSGTFDAVLNGLSKATLEDGFLFTIKHFIYVLCLRSLYLAIFRACVCALCIRRKDYVAPLYIKLQITSLKRQLLRKVTERGYYVTLTSPPVACSRRISDLQFDV